MEINFNEVLRKLDGTDLELITMACSACGRPREYRKATLRAVCTEALLAQYQDERNLPAEEKVKRYELAVRITKEDTIELTLDERQLVRKLVGKMYGSLIVGQVWNKFED